MPKFGGSALLLFGLALMLAWCPYVHGGATTPRWAVIGVAMLALPFLDLTRVTAAHIVGGLFLCWMALSYWWTPSGLDAVDALWKLPALAGLFLIGFSLTDARPFYLGCAAGLLVSSGLVVLDRLELIHYSQTVRPSGLFVNGLYLAEATALIIAALLVRPGRWAWAIMVALMPCLLMLQTLPRGPLMAIGVVIVACVWSRSKYAAGAIVIVGLALLAFAIASRPDSVSQRIEIWTDAARALTWAGHGIGSYFGQAPLIGQFEAVDFRPDYLHNDPLEIAYEGGLPGALLAGAFCGIVLLSRRRRECMVIIAFIIEASFDFPSHLPATFAVFAIAAGYACTDLPHWSDSAIGRRIVLLTRRARHSRGHGRAEAYRGGRLLHPRSRGIPVFIHVPGGAIEPAVRAEWPVSDVGGDGRRIVTKGVGGRSRLD